MRTASPCHITVLLIVAFVPHLSLAQYSGGAGTAKEPYLISTVEDLKTLAEDSSNWDKHFRLMTDLDLSGQSLKPIPATWTKSFSGVFDGNGHILSHFTCKPSWSIDAGLFSSVASSGVVKNLGLTDVQVQGYDAAGGLAGTNEGMITGCFTTGQCMGGRYVGGLVGRNYQGTISCCFSTAEALEGVYDAGGLVGNNWRGSVVECYATGRVSCVSEYGEGGVVGSSGSTVLACFWDTQTSGLQSSDAGEGRTTAQMQDIETFQLAGWDFVSANDGPTDAWAMPEGGGYPILWWQMASPPELPTFAGGTGDEDDPYLLATAEQLSCLGSNPRLMNRCYKLVADIDLTGVALTPVGSRATPFLGQFQGHRYEVLHWTDSRHASDVALFGFIGEGGWVGNLGVTDVNVAGEEVVAALAVRNEGIIQRCYATGCVSGSETVGGLVAYNVGRIMDSYSEVTVLGSDDAAGLVSANGGDIENCYTTGAVSTTGGYTGGLVGHNWGTISRCYAAGPISYQRAGGLVDENNGVVFNCFWDIDSTGLSDSAEGKGRHTAEMKQAATFLGWGGCGELPWTCQDGTDYPRLAWETRCGPALPPQALSDWMTGAGTPEDPYLVATAEQFMAIGAFPCEWDKSFRLMSDLDLSAFSDLGSDRIGLDSDLAFIGSFDGDGYYIRNWSCPVKGDNVGLFGYIGSGGNVCNLRLDGCTVTGRYAVGGLAGVNMGSLINCHVTTQVCDATWYAGLLVGSNRQGVIASCSATGTCTGEYYLGGLVGATEAGTVTACSAEGFIMGYSELGGLIGDNGGTVVFCRAAGTGVGESSAGGLIGENDASVSDSYSLALVLADWNAGGLVGEWFGGDIAACYAAGPVVGGGTNAGGLVGNDYYDSGRTASGCFWDIIATGRTSSAGGQGKTTAQMQTASTFCDAGWDFLGTWTICEGQDYPRLQWEDATCDAQE